MMEGGRKRSQEMRQKKHLQGFECFAKCDNSAAIIALCHFRLPPHNSLRSSDKCAANRSRRHQMSL